MTQFDQEHIEVEAFDREYPIEELLPQELLESIGADSAAMLPGQWAILNERGKWHCQFGPWDPTLSGRLTNRIVEKQPEGETISTHSGGYCIALFPIEYELEIKGYMAVCSPCQDKDQLLGRGRAGVNLLKQLIRLKHQTMLTSGLHGLVVEESYADLKKKAEQLSISEEKYRNLSANLEIEVQKKTEEIRAAHAHMMQQEKMAAIGQLSAGMAHEINNPLGFILSNLTTLMSYAQDLATLMGHYRHLAGLCGGNHRDGELLSVQAQCKTIEKSEQTLDGSFLLADIPVLVDESLAGAQRIQKIVKDLKAVARPGESEQELINIHESLDAVLTIVQNRIGPKIELRRVFSPVPLLYGYPQQISQVWLNLILNALDALENQGTLTISTKAARDQIVVSISDTGMGIAKSDLSKIFDPFFTTKEVGQGTGLGLHLVYHLIAKHGGRISVQSQPGQGTTMTAQLPAEKN
ncbi:MAG: ATP-binding protein [Desulfobacteraceae bacterium]|jgi:signal transduction histidine kinase